MNDAIEQTVRERAYAIWLAAGCGDGRADEHWFTAERSIAAETGVDADGSIGDKAASSKPVRTRTKRPATTAPAGKTTVAAAPRKRSGRSGAVAMQMTPPA